MPRRVSLYAKLTVQCVDKLTPKHNIANMTFAQGLQFADHGMEAANTECNIIQSDKQRSGHHTPETCRKSHTVLSLI